MVLGLLLQRVQLIWSQLSHVSVCANILVSSIPRTVQEVPPLWSYLWTNLINEKILWHKTKINEPILLLFSGNDENVIVKIHKEDMLFYNLLNLRLNTYISLKYAAMLCFAWCLHQMAFIILFFQNDDFIWTHLLIISFCLLFSDTCFIF